MIKPVLIRLKIATKRLLGKCVYAYIYLKNTLHTLLFSPAGKTTPAKRRHKNGIFNLVAVVAERWRFWGLAFLGFFVLYYGLGAIISSKINNSLAYELAPAAKSSRYVPAALGYVLKTQVDDSPWTPALPVIFPAAVLDNLPNFQIGAKNSVKYLVKRMSGYYVDKNLKEAGELLDYPPDIWLFSQTGEDKLAPGSAKQYRKALALINEFGNAPENGIHPTTREFLYILSSLETILNRQIAALHKHVLEHNSDMIDAKADNIFYQALGNAYTVYYILQALSKDYQDMIVESGQYENITSALRFLSEAQSLDPLIVKNASPQDAYAANHLLYLAYYLSQAQNYILSVRADINFKTREYPQ